MVALQPVPLILFNSWLRRERLHSSSTSEVHVFEESKTKARCAVKMVDAALLDQVPFGHDKLREQVLTQHSLLKHPHIVRLDDVHYNAPYVCIKMELAAGGTLDNYIRTHGALKEMAAQWLFLQLLHAVDYCHRKNCRGLVIEPTSVLLVQGQTSPDIKLNAFGRSVQATCSGTEAPELLASMAQHGKSFDCALLEIDLEKADVWSCGAILHFMLFGQLPFGAGSCTEVLSSIHRELAAGENRYSGVSDPCKEVLNMMLAPAAHRCTLSDLWQHPWIQQHLPAGALEFNKKLAGRKPDLTQQQQILNKLQRVEDARPARIQAARSTSHQSQVFKSIDDVIIEEEIIRHLCSQSLKPVHPVCWYM